MKESLRERLKKRYYEHPVIWPLLKKAQELNYRAEYQYYFKLPKNEQRCSIREINLEFSSACNLRCRFCALDHEKPKHTMSPLVLRRFLDQYLSDTRFHSIEKFQLYNGGETLLHPKRLDLLRILKEYRERALSGGIPFPKISLLTNGMLLREGLTRTIIDEGLVDEVGFSLDGGTPEDFEYLRVNAKWPQFYQNVRFFTQYAKTGNRPVRVYGITIVPEPKRLDYSWMHPEFIEIAESFDHHELRRLHDWGGEVSLEGIQPENKTLKHRGCEILMHQMVLLPNGDVTVCCNDLNSKGVVGNILDKSLWQIYRSQERRRYLDLLNQGRKEELELCKNCQTF